MRAVKKRAAAMSRAIDEFRDQHLRIVAVVVFGIAHRTDKAGHPRRNQITL